MALKGAILITEDDPNDAEVVATAIKEIGIPNETRLIYKAEEVYDYLCTTREQPYLILCNIRMAGTDGLAFRRKIIGYDYLRRKSIPFVFFTEVVSQEIVNIAYDLDVQGFYQKAKSYGGLRDQLLTIFVYWKQSLHPDRMIEPFT